MPNIISPTLPGKLSTLPALALDDVVVFFLLFIGVFVLIAGSFSTVVVVFFGVALILLFGILSKLFLLLF